MGDFFHGWRSKLGLVTLFMALLFAAGWVRSLFSLEALNLHAGRISSVQIISECQSLSFVTIAASHPDPRLTSIQYFHDDPDSHGPRVHLGGMRFGGPPASLFNLQFDMNSQTWTVWLFTLSYWSIVIPLTLLSAWLLLSKPRKANLKPITEPVPETAT